MDLACSFLAYYTGNHSLLYTSFIAMSGGVITGWLAATSGLFDLGKVAGTKPGSLKKALIHGGLNSTVLIVYTLLTFMAYKDYPKMAVNDSLTLIIKSCLVALLVLGNFLGGELVLKDKVLE